MEWINVENRIPEKCESVLVTDGHEIYLAYIKYLFKKNKIQAEFYDIKTNLRLYTTHWMTLPSLNYIE